MSLHVSAPNTFLQTVFFDNRIRFQLRYGSFPWTQIRSELQLKGESVVIKNSHEHIGLDQAVAGTSYAAKATTPTTTTTTKPR